MSSSHNTFFLCIRDVFFGNCLRRGSSTSSLTGASGGGHHSSNSESRSDSVATADDVSLLTGASLPNRSSPTSFLQHTNPSSTIVIGRQQRSNSSLNGRSTSSNNQRTTVQSSRSRRRRDNRSTAATTTHAPTNSGNTNVLAGMGEGGVDEEFQVRLAQRIGLIHHLPTGMYQDIGSKKNRECVICMIEFESGDGLRYLPCMHVYHTACIDDWLMRSFTCPSCLQPIESAIRASFIHDDESTSSDQQQQPRDGTS